MKKQPYNILISGFVICLLNIHTSAGQDILAIHNLGHASLMFEFNNLIIHVDPSSSEADYTKLPDADLIFVTHAHSDHYDISALNNIKKESTIMVCSQEVKDKGNYSGTIEVMANGDSNE